MKKLYSLFVLAALLLSYSCTHVIYFDKTPVEEPEDELVVPEGATVITYTTTDDKAIQAGVTKIPNVLSNTYKNGEGRIVIKGTLEEIPEKAFNNFTTLKSITLPNGVKTIGNNAFNGCKNLISVTISDSVISIGDNAFSECDSITSIIIPNSVTSIGEQTFYYCKNLTDVIIGNGVTSIGYQAFDYCDAITDVYISDLIAWCNIDFASRSSNPVDNIATLYLNGTTVTELVIPDEIENIKANAFCGCSSITSVFIPHTVTSIAKDAFFNCNNLKEIYCTSAYPPSGTSSMFTDNASDRKIYVPAESINIYKSAYAWKNYADAIVADPSLIAENKLGTPPSNEIWYISADRNIVTPNNTSAFNANIISNTYQDGIGVIQFDGEITKIGNDAFNECGNLAMIALPLSVTEIGDRAFFLCSALCDILLPNNISSIGSETFYCCAITNITLPYGITKVSYGLFWRCHDLINVNLPESITFIEDFAFFDCISLMDITIPNSVIHIGNATFNLCDSLTAFYGKFASDDNKCLIVDGTIVAFAIGCDAIEYTTPSNVTAIGYCSFEECKNLKHIIISEGVTRIDSGAFCNSNSLETVTIPNSMLTSIAHSIDIFQLCNNLRAFYGKFASNDNRCLIIDNELVCFAPFGMKEYTIPYGITTIGSRSFISCTNITNINIPDSVTSIEYYAFFNCQNLTSITIPVNVSLIEQYTFAQCENLSHVYCKPNTPPIIEENVFTFFTNGAYEKLNCKIYVPRASVDAYKAAEGWKEYADAIEPYDF